MIWNHMPDSSVELSLKYNGPEVDDGTMSIAEVVDALQGFAAAYGKVANVLIPESKHELRITNVTQSSFELHILAWLASHGTTALHDVENVGKGAGIVFGVIKGYIKLKKFLKGDRYEIVVSSDGNTKLVMNRDGETSEVPADVIALLQAKTIDGDLKKVVGPLDEGKINNLEIKAKDGEDTEEVTIESAERVYFGESFTETIEDAQLTGRLISNNKETLRGTFELADGTRFPYRYTGQNPEVFQSTYAYCGSVRVTGRANIGEDSKIKRIEVTDAIALQTELELTPSTSQQALPPSTHDEPNPPPSQE